MASTILTGQLVEKFTGKLQNLLAIKDQGQLPPANLQPDTHQLLQPAGNAVVKMVLDNSSSSLQSIIEKYAKSNVINLENSQDQKFNYNPIHPFHAIDALSKSQNQDKSESFLEDKNDKNDLKLLTEICKRSMLSNSQTPNDNDEVVRKSSRNHQVVKKSSDNPIGCKSGHSTQKSVNKDSSQLTNTKSQLVKYISMYNQATHAPKVNSLRPLANQQKNQTVPVMYKTKIPIFKINFVKLPMNSQILEDPKQLSTGARNRKNNGNISIKNKRGVSPDKIKIKTRSQILKKIQIAKLNDDYYQPILTDPAKTKSVILDPIISKAGNPSQSNKKRERVCEQAKATSKPLTQAHSLHLSQLQRQDVKEIVQQCLFEKIELLAQKLSNRLRIDLQTSQKIAQSAGIQKRSLPSKRINRIDNNETNPDTVQTEKRDLHQEDHRMRKESQHLSVFQRQNGVIDSRSRSGTHTSRNRNTLRSGHISRSGSGHISRSGSGALNPRRDHEKFDGSRYHEEDRAIIRKIESNTSKIEKKQINRISPQKLKKIMIIQALDVLQKMPDLPQQRKERIMEQWIALKQQAKNK